MTFARRLTKSAGHTVHASFILDLSYLAHITPLYLALIILRNFLIKIKIFYIIDHMHMQCNVVIILCCKLLLFNKQIK